MVIDIVIAILLMILAVGFLTGKLDWWLIHYGCAPAKVKEKMDGEKILTIAWIMTFISAIFFVFAAVMYLLFLDNYVLPCRILGITVFVIMYIWTFIVSRHRKK